MKILISSVFCAFIAIQTLLNCIYCDNVASYSSLNLKNVLFKNSDNGSRAVDYFYDINDFDESIKQQIVNSVSKELKDKKILKGSDDEEASVTVKIKSPIKSHGGQIKVEVVEGANEAESSYYTRNSSKLNSELDDNEYFPAKSDDGTNVLCEDWRNIALEKQRLKPSVFVPKCNPDGSYVTTQCDDVAGICWCVNQFGEEIGGTLVRFEKPKCNKKKPRKGIVILASGQNLIDIGSSEEEVEGFKCAKEKRSVEKLKTHFNETTQRIRVPVCDDDDYAPVQCTANKKHCWCVGKNGEEISKSGKVGMKPTNCTDRRKADTDIAEVTHDWPYLWKVISEWLSIVRATTEEQRQDNAKYVYKPRGVLVKLAQSSGFKKSMIFLPQESPDNETETPYSAWLKIMKHENPTFNALSYEIDFKEMSKFQSVEVPDGKGNYYLITVSDFLKASPTFEELWKKVNHNVSEFESHLKKQEQVDWKKLSEQPKPETSDPTGILAAGTFEMRSEQKVCFCYNKRYWEKLQRFIGSNNTLPESGEAKVHGRSLRAGPGKGAQSGICRTVCDGDGGSGGGARSAEMDENVVLLEGLTMQDVMDSETTPEAKAKVDNVLRKQISKINPMRNLLQMNIEHFEQLSGIEFNNIQVPARYFTPPFWRKFSEYTQRPMPAIEKELGFDMNAAMEQSSLISNRRPQAINIGRMIRLMSRSNMNTQQVMELMGYSTRVMVDDLENSLFVAVRASLRAVAVPYRVIKTYLDDPHPVTKITSTIINSAPAAIPGTVAFRTGICNFGFSLATMVRSVPEYVKDVQVYFGDQQKCVKDCPTFNQDMTRYIKSAASSSYAASFAMQVNVGARLYRQVPLYMRLYMRKTLRKAGFTFMLGSEAHLEMLFQTGAMLGVGAVKPFVKVPYILFLGDGSILDRTLGSFPAIVELTGDLVKPLMVVSEPLLRGGVFMLTGDYHRSLNAGRGHSENFEKNVMNDFTARSSLLENYQPYSVRRGQVMGPDGYPVDKEVHEEDDEWYPRSPLQTVASKSDALRRVQIDPDADMLPVNTTVDPDELETTFLDRYGGMAPQKGYAVDFNRYQVLRKQPQIKYGLVSRFIQLPFFMLVAGGPVYGPASNLVTPVLNMTLLFTYSDLQTYEKIRQVPEILESSSAFYKPVTMLMNGFMPITDLLYDFWTEKATAIQTTARAPVAFMALATSPLKFIISGPSAMFKEASDYWVGGSTGINSMVQLQFSDNYVGNKRGYVFRRAQEAYAKAKVYVEKNPEHDNLLFMASYMGAYYAKPHMDVVSSMFNGGVGNVIDASKLYQYEFLSWDSDPYNSMVKLSQNQAAMYEVANDKNMFVQSVLGGEDPDELRVVGIDAQKLVRANIDPMKMLLGGEQMLPLVQQRSIFNGKPNQTELERIGINENDLQRIGLTYEQLMSGGLWNAKQDALLDFGIDPFLLVNRMMRQSIVDKRAFISCGISVRKMISTGIRPDYFLAAGVSAVSSRTWKRLEINPTRTNDPIAFFKIGISFDILVSLNVNPVTFVERGIGGFNESVVRAVFGIDKQKLLSSVYLGFSEAALFKMGIQAKKMFRAGYSPVDLVTGSNSLAKLKDEELLQVGINVKAMRAADLKPRSMLQHGILAKDMYKFNRLGVNADQLLGQLYTKSGVGLLADNQYSREDDVYEMAASMANIARKNGAPELPEVYNFMTKEKRSLMVMAKEKTFEAVGYTGNVSFFTWLVSNLAKMAYWFVEWLIFYAPFQFCSLFGFISELFKAAGSSLYQSVSPS